LDFSRVGLLRLVEIETRGDIEAGGDNIILAPSLFAGENDVGLE
jgi:hypothetical protein